MNCAQGPTPDPVRRVRLLRALAPNGPGSIDVIEIDAASHGGVDDARDLRERAFFAPVRDPLQGLHHRRGAHGHHAGFNALLKLVEEPPDFLVFVFATTEPDKVLADHPLAHPPLPVPAGPAGRAARTLWRHLRRRARHRRAGRVPAGRARRCRLGP